MHKPFVARYGVGNRSVMQDYPGPADPAADAVEPFDWVTLTAGRIAVVAGPDPTDLLGIARGGNQLGTGAIRDDQILVEVFTHDSLVAMTGDVAPVAETHIGNAYGIVYDATAERWEVDTSDAVNTRVTVVDVDEDRGWYLVRVLAAHRQEG